MKKPIDLLPTPPSHLNNYFKSVYNSLPIQSQDELIIPLGFGTSLDICKAPHILVAGQSGSGKSVFLNSLISTLMISNSPEELGLILIDPKVVEFMPYSNIPHLLFPIATENSEAIKILDWAIEEMESRFRTLSEAKVRNISGYNSKARQGNTQKMKKIIIIIDEFADLLYGNRKEIEPKLVRIAQKSRAVGIHLILATQRPSREVVTGILKANIPVRICFKVASEIDSRIVLDSKGGETLKGNGEGIVKGLGGDLEGLKFQGAWIGDHEIETLSLALEGF